MEILTTRPLMRGCNTVSVVDDAELSQHFVAATFNIYPYRWHGMARCRTLRKVMQHSVGACCRKQVFC
jgi:hypothetical protein